MTIGVFFIFLLLPAGEFTLHPDTGQAAIDWKHGIVCDPAGVVLPATAVLRVPTETTWVEIDHEEMVFSVQPAAGMVVPVSPYQYAVIPLVGQDRQARVFEGVLTHHVGQWRVHISGYNLPAATQLKLDEKLPYILISHGDDEKIPPSLFNTKHWDLFPRHDVEPLRN
ncbi:MAG TPA: hypothetical protein PK878_02490 [bacterium]|nr:hypothetical protein [bacterium]